MSENTGTPAPQVETTSVFRADLLKEMENGANGNDATVAGTDNLAEGQALLVVKRGPNAGARFLLDQATTTAGRHPEADIFLDDAGLARPSATWTYMVSDNPLAGKGNSVLSGIGNIFR